MMLSSAPSVAGRKVAQARARGANVIVNVRFTTSYIMGSASEILAYGEAVELAQE